jgi:hypothetical protein
MKYLIGALAVALSVLGISCGGNAPVEKETAQQQKLANTTNAGGARQGSGTAANGNASAGIGAPKDARFTVFCGTFSGPGHIQQAKAMKEQLAAKSGMRDWYTVSGEGQTTLYYGFYREVNEQIDAREGTRAQLDRKRIAAMTGTNGGRLFNSVLLVGIDEVDPSSPPEWNLENAKGVWTVQIGVYKDHPQRKQYAVDVVRDFRKQGYEAYYYHGPTASSVCIGVWPAESVKADDEIRMTDPNAVPLIAPGSLPVKEGITTPDGRPIQVMRTKTQVLDESLLATMRAFPNHFVNGVTGQTIKDPRTGQTRAEMEPSLLVRVPAKRMMLAGPGVSGEAVGDGTGAAGQPRQQPTGPDPLRAVLPGKVQQGGRLKSLE